MEAEISRMETEIDQLTEEEKRISEQIHETQKRRKLLLRQSVIAGSGVFAVLILAFAFLYCVVFKK